VLGGGFVVTVYGSGFLPGAQIWVDGVPLLTVLVSPGVLTAVAPPHSAGTAVVQVSNPGPSYAVGSGTLAYAAPPANLILAPVPSKKGQPVCLYSDSPLLDSDWTIFGTDQQVVARLRDGSAQPCFSGTAGLAPGTYLVRIRSRDASGKSSTVVRNLILEP
jgi:hypothetical protein